MAYIRFPIETNPETLVQDVYDFINIYYPDWRPVDGNLDVMIVRALAFKIAENRDLASDVQDAIYRDFGARLMAIPPLDAAPAIGSTTWTMIDTAGHTIPAGTQVSLSDSSGNAFPFYTIASVVVAPGGLSTPVGAVSIVALNPGTDSNNLGGVVNLVDVLDYVQSVAIVGTTVGGIDAEADGDYLDRLVRRLQRLSQVPILPPDFADAAFDASPEVDRAVALDGYNPAAGGTWNNDRMVTIAAATVTGDPVSAAAKTAIDNYLQARREVNFIVNEMDPQYTLIDVHTDFKTAAGYDPPTVKASIEAALNNYLSPANFAKPAPHVWVETTKVYYYELVALVSNILGVDRVSDLTVNIHGNAAGRIDITITNPAGLTRPSTIVATAV